MALSPSLSTILAQSLIILTYLATTSHQSPTNNTDCIGQGSLHFSLTFDIYQTTCPPVEDIVYSIVSSAVDNDPRMAASLLRLHFHDCFVNGCDGSVLLDDGPGFQSEKKAGPNLNSLRGFEVIDAIKSELEMNCPQTVSCSDILAIAARDSVVLLNGPSWQVEMGRKDSLTASLSGANNNIPAPTSDVATLTQKFQNVGLSQKDMVSLSGAHTIGKAQCRTFSSRLSGSNADGDLVFLQSLLQLCSSGSNSTLALLDLSTPMTFDNQYYVNLMSGVGLLPSDQVLTSDSFVASLVEDYAVDKDHFFDDFSASMVRMGRLAPPAGMAGEVRTNCRVVN